MTAYINGKQGIVYVGNEAFVTIAYTFPRLSDGNYDLWIAGLQVNDDNKNKLGEIIADLDDEALERYFADEMDITFDETDNTLTLKNAIIRTDVNGIESKMPDLNIKLIGDNIIGALSGTGIYLYETEYEGATTFFGGGSLNIESDNPGIRTQVDVVMKDGVQITAESAYIGIQGKTGDTGTTLPTLTLEGRETILKAKGEARSSLASFSALILNDGLAILEPIEATFAENVGIVKDGVPVVNEWVMIANQDYIDGIKDLNVDLNHNDGWYSLDGRKLWGKPTQRGIYIKDGKKMLIK